MHETVGHGVGHPELLLPQPAVWLPSDGLLDDLDRCAGYR